MGALWNRFSIGWCKTFHGRPSWPTHGHYYCPSCLRTYPVPWHEGDAVARQGACGPLSRSHGFTVFAFQKDRG